jgi:hypothetical protein
LLRKKNKKKPTLPPPPLPTMGSSVSFLWAFCDGFGEKRERKKSENEEELRWRETKMKRDRIKKKVIKEREGEKESIKQIILDQCTPYVTYVT